MRVGIPQELTPGEKRVALHPQVVQPLIRLGFQVVVQAGAGRQAGLDDESFAKAGAQIETDPQNVWKTCDVIFKVSPPQHHANSLDETACLRHGQVCVGFLDPLGNPKQIERLAARGAHLFAMELIPRTSRAQTMDALSSQANLMGYSCVLLAAHHLPKLLPMLMTAAGTVGPAQVLVIGAGVAGLQAIATAKRLGARVFAYDVRPAVKEQVQSLGAQFVNIPVQESAAGEEGYAQQVTQSVLAQQQEGLAKTAQNMDIILTTAQVPGAKAPVLITQQALTNMKPGSVVVDLACTSGGNVEGSKPNETICTQGVTVLGPTNLAASLCADASLLYARNLLAFLQLLVRDGQLNATTQDDIATGCCVAQNGKVTHPRVLQRIKQLQESS
ncbi:MAG: Re/Si-specific NAD(P)(+) transhydrogenase subunit alpha [Myxococcota bacterium]